MNLILSIVIPTKNRQKYCIEAIKSVLQLNNRDIEVVIQDNSDNDSLGATINKMFEKENIIYNHHPGVLSFVDNFSEAVSISSGEYICLIGDDDAVLPQVIDAIRFMERNQYDCVVPSLSAVYIWPSDNPYVEDARHGKLSLYKSVEKSAQVNVDRALLNLVKNGGQGYQAFHLPRLYHGIVSRKFLDKIQLLKGTYFFGLTPDISNAVALAVLGCKTYFWNSPITISGICPKSASAASATGKHTGELRDAPHFLGHDNYAWDDRAPYIYCVETIWGETVMHTLNVLDASKYNDAFSISMLDAFCLFRHKEFKDRILEHAREHDISKPRIYMAVFKLILKGGLNRIKHILTGEIKPCVATNISDINDAITTYEKLKI